ncbi:MAG: GTP cyclohydrolase I FolE [Bdellovibrionales bacterium]|nr:GTP cyclohydrolase I FolE [Bdellovibrionales bacterium]
MSEHDLSVELLLGKVIPTPFTGVSLSEEEQIAKISEKFKEIMEILGLDLKDDSLKDTPKRVAKMYVNELFSGLKKENFPKITVIDNKMGYDQMIVVKNVGIMSLCEHHFQTIDGLATIAYIPNKKVVGLSKINRIAKFFSRRPQVQERLTKQIADCLQYALETNHIVVHIDARHYCLVSRGVEDARSSTSTCELRGDFLGQPHTRAEFLRHCHTGALQV